MRLFPCPACGATITFHSPVSIHAVCEFCRSTVVRRDVNVEAIGTMAGLPDDMSPFQIGSQGVFGTIPFTIIGQAKMAWKHGTWNEWFLWCDDGRRGWLAEAQGFLALSFELDEPWPADVAHSITRLKQTIESNKLLAKTQAALSALPVGTVYRFSGVVFELVDAKFSHCIGSAGELPIAATHGRTTITLDFIGLGRSFAGIEFTYDGPRVFLGEYVDWDHLNIKHGREFEGWT